MAFVAVSAAADAIPGLRAVGSRSLDEIYQLMGRARFLVVPSQWYENFPRVVVESLACGTPIVTSRLGALAEIVEHGRTGLHFRAGDADDLARQMLRATTNDAERLAMRRGARAEFEAKYTAERNYDRLLQIYEQAIAESGRS